ncbi:DUF336-domain-containing protein [Rhizodiscina lignyota]|uniref:DUF336-domain-containing protein n=1 Tax=Rhizodiscina lignyota TaxID=1504668 RepID=A0A9P4IKF8_9PEZI|nr:DUF336-domain-containing protein [Rhizodiscina lignyota]
MRFAVFSNLIILACVSLVSAQSNTTASLGTLGSTPNQRRSLNEAQAMRILSAATEKATSLGIRENIAVLDPAGFLLAFIRMDNSFLASIDISQKKAKSVALFNGAMTSGALGMVPNASNTGLDLTNNGLLGVAGGVPVFIDGVFFGAVGVSGGSSDQDVEVATAGVNAVGSTQM